MNMIRNLKFHKISRSKIDYVDYELRRQIGSPIMNCDRPETIDIKILYVIIHFEGVEYSFARPYKLDKVILAKRSNNKYRETIEKRTYKIQFNNPYNKEKEITGFVVLSVYQNIKFLLYRFIRWLRIKENILWLTNILILLLNAICGFFKCC